MRRHAIDARGLNFSGRFLLAFLFCCSLPSNGYANGDAALENIIRGQLELVSTRPDSMVHGEYLSALEDLVSLYNARSFAAVWSRDGRLQPQSGELLSVIQGASREGLDPHDYHVESLEILIDQVRHKPDPQSLAESDLILTDALLTYSKDLQQGRLRKGNNLEAVNADMRSLLTSVFSDGVGLSLSLFGPASPAYARLREALQHYRLLSEREILFSIPGSTLKKGDAGVAVAALRRRLTFLGDLHGESGGNEPFDETIEQALLRFQGRHGLQADGIVGPETRAALAVPMTKRVSQIEYNLERWRWLPHTLGSRYITVNIAGFTLEVTDRTEPVLRMRVIVGKPSQQTPVFSSTVTSLVLNPYWNIPHSIATREILSQLRSNPGYLEQNNIRLLQVRNIGTIEIDPDTINWHDVSGSNFPYRLRQDPGPGNALGRIKFFLPNPYSVFIHDTPAKSLFSRAIRDFSHGCVRLEKPFELALFLLKNQPEWAGQLNTAILAPAHNRRVDLSQPIPIHMVYRTAWVDLQGIVNFRRDIYRRDQRLALALEGMSLN